MVRRSGGTNDGLRADSRPPGKLCERSGRVFGGQPTSPLTEFARWPGLGKGWAWAGLLRRERWGSRLAIEKDESGTV